MQYVLQGVSIESEASEIISRDIKRGSYIDIPKIGKCAKYNCKRNSEAAIRQELNPKQAIYKADSKLDLHDSISGENLIFCVSPFKKVSFDVINYTGRHKAQRAITNCYSFAELTLQFQFLKQLNDPNQEANQNL